MLWFLPKRFIAVKSRFETSVNSESRSVTIFKPSSLSTCWINGLYVIILLFLKGSIVSNPCPYEIVSLPDQIIMSLVNGDSAGES